MIYLDNAATTRIDPEVLEAMMPYLTDEYGNAGTLYELGFTARKAVEEAREKVAAFVGADSPEQIIFTSGGTESNNMVFHSYGVLEENKSRCVVVSSIEHDSVLRSARTLNTKLGFDLSYVAPDVNGVVTKDILHRHLRCKDLGLASIMYMNNEVGSISDVSELSNECHNAGGLLHSDCVQAAGCLDINVNDMCCDFASISSHKIHGPKGVGALFVRDKKFIAPLIEGGSEQEYGFRGGTENVAGIVGLGTACELCKRANTNIPTSHKRRFWNILCSVMKEKGLRGIVHDNAMSSITYGKTINVRFEGVDSEALVLLLGVKGVCVSAGSACTSHEQQPSHVLTGIGLSKEQAMNSIRVSFSRMNTDEEVSEAATIVANAAEELYIQRGV